MILFDIGGREDSNRDRCLFQVGFPSRSRDNDFFESLAFRRTRILRAGGIAGQHSHAPQCEDTNNTRANSSMYHRIYSRTCFRCWWTMPEPSSMFDKCECIDARDASNGTVSSWIFRHAATV